MVARNGTALGGGGPQAVVLPPGPVPMWVGRTGWQFPGEGKPGRRSLPGVKLAIGLQNMGMGGGRKRPAGKVAATSRHL